MIGNCTTTRSDVLLVMSCEDYGFLDAVANGLNQPGMTKRYRTP